MNRDLRSNVASDLAFYAAIASDTTTTGGQVLDTAHYESGVMYSFAAPVWADGIYTPLIEESDDPGMAGATPVADEDLIGTEADAALSAETAIGDSLPTVGYIGNKKFIEIKIVSTGFSSGGATIAVFTSKAPESRPVQ